MHILLLQQSVYEFIRPTGRDMGMRVDEWIDDRRDPELATDAAVRITGYSPSTIWRLATRLGCIQWRSRSCKPKNQKVQNT